MNTLEVGKTLVELCNAGEYEKAIQDLYADDATHIEVCEMPGMPKVVTGKADLLASMQQWVEGNEIHSGHTTGPFPHDDRFICLMTTEITPKAGPMAGNRMKLEEACHYTVTDGKISKVEFYYDMEMPGG
ncbi:MAG: nuclear transport factor 2 family protein [Planctomycetota bacterium]